ncbi:MAG: hypothetical protein U0324_28490 [Polyangiales bacterium]
MRPLEALPDATRKHLATLALRAYDLASPFACGGEMAPVGDAALCFAKGSRVALGADDWRLGETLARRCEPAPFGQGGETKRNRKVRDALQLDARGGAFTVEGLDPAAGGVLDAVRKALCPHDPNPLSAELYGLNIYRRGGHFVVHKDTPRGDDMLGTLVMDISHDFGGGDLVLTHRGATEVFRWSIGRLGRRGPRTFSWAAFFGDVDHEVREVWSGERITLTWILRRGEGAVLPVRRASTHADRLADSLTVALVDPSFFPTGTTLGFSCFHMYAEAPGFIRSAPEINPRTALKLKGRDQQIAAAVLRLGLPVRFVPYLLEDQVDSRWALARYPTHTERAMFRGHRLSAFDIERRLPVEAGPDRDAVRWVVTPARGDRGRAAARVAGQPAVEFLGEPEYSETGYFGNEGGPGEFYVHAALLVDVPALGVRKRALGGERKPAKPPARKAPAPDGPPAGKVLEAPPSRELTAAEVRALGYSAAQMKRMVADGTLERTGFGWYRFTRAL